MKSKTEIERILVLLFFFFAILIGLFIHTVDKRFKETISNMKIELSSDKAAAVDRDYHWIPIDENTPVGVAIWVIRRDYGVGVRGVYTKENPFKWTHWAKLPTFAKRDNVGG